ncbi:MAG: hypothetical protein ACI9A7_002459, partial [Cyclobacteriaceae bacterium]
STVLIASRLPMTLSPLTISYLRLCPRANPEEESVKNKRMAVLLNFLIVYLNDTRYTKWLLLVIWNFFF